MIEPEVGPAAEPEGGTLLAWSAVVVAGGAVGYLALTGLIGLAETRHAVGGAVFLLALGGVGALARLGRVRAASWTLVGALFAVVAGLVVGEGIGSPTVAVLYLVTLLAAVLIGARAALGVASASAAFVVAVGELQAGRLLIAPFPDRVVEIGLALQLLMAGGLAGVFADRFRRRGQELERRQRELQRHNEELEAQRRRLRTRARQDRIVAEVARRAVTGEPIDEIEAWARHANAGDLGGDEPVPALAALPTPTGSFDQAVDTTLGLVRERIRAQRIEVMGRLAGGIAHDFNNLLTVILGGLESALERDDLHPEARVDLRDAEKAAHRAAAMTQRLLSFGRPRRGPPARVELGGTVEELASVLRRLVGEGVEVVVGRSPDPLVVNADPALVEQAVMNLVVNAHEAMPRGGRVTLRVGPTHEADGVAGDWVLMEVRDQGAGMPPAVAERLFEPLFTTKGEGGGTGLGLAAVRALIDETRGRVAVRSEPGAGTTFRLWLPRLDVTPPPSATQDPAPERTGGLVLVVDDEPAVGSAIRLMLVRARYEVVLTETLEEALAAARARGAGLRALVTDLGLRGTSGREVADRVRAEIPGLPVLFVSGHPQGELPLGPEERFLPKPFGRDELLRELAACLRARTDG